MGDDWTRLLVRPKRNPARSTTPAASVVGRSLAAAGPVRRRENQVFSVFASLRVFSACFIFFDWRVRWVALRGGQRSDRRSLVMSEEDQILKSGDLPMDPQHISFFLRRGGGGSTLWSGISLLVSLFFISGGGLTPPQTPHEEDSLTQTSKCSGPTCLSLPE